MSLDAAGGILAPCEDPRRDGVAAPAASLLAPLPTPEEGAAPDGTATDLDLHTKDDKAADRARQLITEEPGPRKMSFTGEHLHPVRAAIQRGKSARVVPIHRRRSSRVVLVDEVKGRNVTLGSVAGVEEAEGGSMLRRLSKGAGNGSTSEEGEEKAEPHHVQTALSLADIAEAQMGTELPAMDTPATPGGQQGYRAKRMSQWLGVQKPLRRISVLHHGDSYQSFKYVLDPRSLFRRIWDAGTACLVLYLCFIVPFFIGFAWYKPALGLKVLSYILDVWFMIDIALNFRTGYIDCGYIHMKPSEIRRNYLAGWFVIDLAGSIPFDWFIKDEPDVTESTGIARKTIKTLKYLKLAKLLRLGRVVRLLRAYARFYGLFLLGFGFIFMSHFVSCMWIAVLDPCSDEKYYYARQNGPCGQFNIWRLYAAALHDGVSTMLGVLGTTELVLLDEVPADAQNVSSGPGLWMWKCFVQILGLVFTSLLMGNVVVIFLNFASASYAFRRKIDGIKSEMHYYNLPAELQRKIKAYYEYMWINQKHFGDSSLLRDKDMSLTLRQEVTLFLYKDVIKDVPFFRNIEDDRFLCNVSTRLTPRIYLPKDFIIIHGDKGEEMFLLSKGTCKVLNEQGVELSVLSKGDFFGEMALIYHSRRSATVQASGICEVSVLTFASLEALMEEFKYFKKNMVQLAADHLMADRLNGINRTFMRDKLRATVYEGEQPPSPSVYTPTMGGGSARAPKDRGTEKRNSGTLGEEHVPSYAISVQSSQALEAQLKRVHGLLHNIDRDMRELKTRSTRFFSGCG